MRTLVFAACFALRAAWAGDGGVDPTFGEHGHVVFAPADASLSAYATAIDDEGRILVGGSRWAFAEDGMPNQAVVWRLLANGAPDPSFGDGGIAIVPILETTGLPAIQAVLPLHDGRVLAAGNLGGFGVARLRADGGIDADFGSGGITTIPLGDSGVGTATVFAIARDGDGRILLAGSGNAATDATWIVAVAVRLSSDGALDTTFASAGRFVLASGDATTRQTTLFRGVAGDAVGRVWLSGRVQATASAANFSALAVRLDADGARDARFGNAGIVSANRHAGSDDNTGPAVLRGDRLTIGGICDPVAGDDPAMCLLRLDADGHPDDGFGAAGWVSMPLGQAPLRRDSAIACGNDGRCVLLGMSLDPASSTREFAVLRIDARGAPDASFGDAGIARIAVPTTGDGTHVAARAIALQGGQPVAVGATDGVPSISALYATRLASDAMFADGFDTVR